MRFDAKKFVGLSVAIPLFMPMVEAHGPVARILSRAIPFAPSLVEDSLKYGFEPSTLHNRVKPERRASRVDLKGHAADRNQVGVTLVTTV